MMLCSPETLPHPQGCQKTASARLPKSYVPSNLKSKRVHTGELKFCWHGRRRLNPVRDRPSSILCCLHRPLLVLKLTQLLPQQIVLSLLLLDDCNRILGAGFSVDLLVDSHTLGRVHILKLAASTAQGRLLLFQFSLHLANLRLKVSTSLTVVFRRCSLFAFLKLLNFCVQLMGGRLLQNAHFLLLRLKVHTAVAFASLLIRARLKHHLVDLGLCGCC
mmetsp:Transcript_49130/g.111224  ORF Transcript_49130/g.111224 Transcript_49130/m.111224 type:complete len:218 (-) Transcript_49130:578-1231(-)